MSARIGAVEFYGGGWGKRREQAEPEVWRMGLQPRALFLKPDSYINLMSQRILIPLMMKTLIFGRKFRMHSHTLVTGVFAIAAKGGSIAMSKEEVKTRREDIHGVLTDGKHAEGEHSQNP